MFIIGQLVLKQKITNNARHDPISNCDIDGNTVVYQRSMVFPMIFSYDLTTGLTQQISGGVTSSNPKVFDKKIVYTKLYGMQRSSNIHVYDLTTNTETVLTPNAPNQYNPVIHSKWVSWESVVAGNRNIYLYDLDARVIKQITFNTSFQAQPAIFASGLICVDAGISQEFIMAH